MTQLLLYRGTVLNFALGSLLPSLLGIRLIRPSKISKGQTTMFVPYFRIDSKHECRIELKLYLNFLFDTQNN